MLTCHPLLKNQWAHESWGRRDFGGWYSEVVGSVSQWTFLWGMSLGWPWSRTLPAGWLPGVCWHHLSSLPLLWQHLLQLCVPFL